jgi:hypothetical protein
MHEPQQPNAELLLQLVKMKMPFGKYKDTFAAVGINVE